MSEDKYRAALDAAAKQLSYRALSAKMLRDKLLDKGHDEEAADYALAWLTERRLLDDAAYAESVVRGYTRKGYGEMRIRQELGRRGVDRETADAAMQQFSPDRAQLHALLDKRLRGDVSDRAHSCARSGENCCIAASAVSRSTPRRVSSCRMRSAP